MKNDYRQEEFLKEFSMFRQCPHDQKFVHNISFGGWGEQVDKHVMHMRHFDMILTDRLDTTYLQTV